jgi:hypothetical protein
MDIRSVYYLKSQTDNFLYTLSCNFAISMIKSCFVIFSKDHSTYVKYIEIEMYYGYAVFYNKFKFL